MAFSVFVYGDFKVPCYEFGIIKIIVVLKN